MKQDLTLEQRGIDHIEQVLKLDYFSMSRILNLLPVGIYITDAEGYLTLYNKAAVDLWGRAPKIGEELWCGSWKIFRTDGSELPLHECPMAIALKEGKTYFEAEIIVERPDGIRKQIAVNPRVVTDDKGKVVYGLNMLVDITEARRAESELKEKENQLQKLNKSLQEIASEKSSELKNVNKALQNNEDRYHKMIEEVEDYAILFMDRNGIIQNWNKGAEKIKGYKDYEIVGKSFRLFYLPEDNQRGLPDRLLYEARTTGKAVHEGWRVRKDGTTFWGSIVITALHDANDNIIGFTKVTRDLTERKLTEEKIKLYSQELEFQNKELEQFAYAASHDMKEPLRKIHFYNSYISENAAAVLDERSKDYLARSLNAVKRMSSLIEDLLIYSRTNYNQEYFEEVNLNKLLEEIVQTHREETEQENLTIKHDDLPIVCGIPFQLKQLTENLINNSIKYRDRERPACITIKSTLVKGSELPVSDIEPEKSYYKLSFMDNGIGFNPESAEKIFEIFHRLGNQTGPKGSGIGLAICKKIVQNHHGFITATGKVNEGAQFDVYLPAIEKTSHTE